MVVRIEAQVQWFAAYDAGAKVYMGVCPGLNLNAIGDTWIDFQECANEAMGALLTDLFRSGEFEQFMRTHSWRPMRALERGDTPRFDIPFETKLVPELNVAYA